MTPSAELTIGTAMRTVADGCGRQRNVERRHPQPPDPQSETGTLATHSEKNGCACGQQTRGWRCANFRTGVL